MAGMQREQGEAYLRAQNSDEKDGGGMRFNAGKTRYGLIPESWTRALAEVMTRGAVKYAPNNWKRGMDPAFMLDSLQRHLAAYRRGEKYDPESGNHHLAHAAWNALALMTYDLEGMVGDEFFEPEVMPTSVTATLGEPIFDEQAVFPHPALYDESVDLLYWETEEDAQRAHDLLGGKAGIESSAINDGMWMMNSTGDQRKYIDKFPAYFSGMRNTAQRA